MTRSAQSPEQGELFLTEIGRQGPVVPVDFSENEDPNTLAVPLLENRIYLVNCITYFRHANMLEGFAKSGRYNAEDHYGDGASKVLEDAASKRAELLQKAEESFKKATGYHALLEVEIDDPAYSQGRMKAQHRTMWSDFIKAYNLPTTRENGRRYRAELQRHIEILAGNPEVSISKISRLEQRRPHTAQAAVERGELNPLARSERLEAILLDPRAQFLPKTHRSLVRVMTWLDYLDNPEKELGIINQMQEVLVRAENPTRKSSKPNKHLGIRHGIRALESLTWELGDDYIEATQNLHALKFLRSALQEGIRPTLSMHDAFCDPGTDIDTVGLKEFYGEHTQGLIAFVRYMDVLEYMRRGGQVGGLQTSPLKIIENPPRSQRPKEDSTPGKRKTVYGQYSRPDMTPEFEIHIMRKLETMTVKEARQFIGDCVEDTANERQFYERRLSDLSRIDIPLHGPVHNALHTIRQQIQSTVG